MVACLEQPGVDGNLQQAWSRRIARTDDQLGDWRRAKLGRPETAWSGNQTFDLSVAADSAELLLVAAALGKHAEFPAWRARREGALCDHCCHRMIRKRFKVDFSWAVFGTTEIRAGMFARLNPADRQYDLC
ncbi:hypothetical protein [Mesorhizobium sp. M1365]|uniref:hypothetical protein n=1 Tax=Mesorhizobium sp. M1365 TaxID=2957090 RepID=UPI003339B468